MGLMMPADKLFIRVY